MIYQNVIGAMDSAGARRDDRHRQAFDETKYPDLRGNGTAPAATNGRPRLRSPPNTKPSSRPICETRRPADRAIRPRSAACRPACRGR